MKEPEVIVIPDGLHSVRGPSSSERWLACGAGVGGPMTEYAASGTAHHSLSEWMRLEGKPSSAWKGKILQVGDYQFKIGKAMMHVVDTFVDSVQCLPGAPIVEEMVHYDELVEGGFGTLDDARLHLDAGIITDLKSGKGVVVAAKDNPQLMLYALGIFFKYDWIYKFKKFVLRISQPPRGVVAEQEAWEIKTGDLLAWGYDVVRPRAQLLATGALKNQYEAGPHCKFCGLKNTCEVRGRYKAQHESGSFVRDASEELVTLDE